MQRHPHTHTYPNQAPATGAVPVTPQRVIVQPQNPGATTTIVQAQPYHYPHPAGVYLTVPHPTPATPQPGHPHPAHTHMHGHR